MSKNSRFFTLCRARLFCLVGVLACPSAWAQAIAQDPASAAQGTSPSQGTSPAQDPSQVTTQTSPATRGSEQPITAAGAADPASRVVNGPSNPYGQLPPDQTSAQQQVDQGLAPTLGSGVSTSAFANGIVSTFPGATSFGANAAGAAANARNFLTTYATQSVSYSDNPGNLGSGQVIASTFQLQSLNRPDFFETTSGGVLLSKRVSLQNFFASANFGVTNYAHDTNFNSTRYSFSVGDNYAIGDECTGTIVANTSQSAVPLEFTVGSLAAQNTQNTSGEITSQCRVTGHIFTTTDLRASRSSFTNGSGSTSSNNSNQLLGSAGLEYVRSGFLTLGVLSSVQRSDFTGRDPLLLGLSERSSQVNFNAFINKPISPKLNVSLSGGISDLSMGSPSLSGTISPLFTASISYVYSPKTSFFFNYAQLTGSPQSFVSNSLQIETIAFGVNYRFSPKTSIVANVSRSSTSGGGTSNSGVSTFAQLLTNSQTTSERVSANYTISRDASASLSYQHTTRDAGFLSGVANTNNVSLSLSYRR